MSKPVLLLTGQSFHREHSRGSLFFELLSKRVHKSVVSVPFSPVGASRQPFRSVSRTVSRYIFGVLLTAQCPQRSTFFVIPSCRWRQIIHGELPESQVKSGPGKSEYRDLIKNMNIPNHIESTILGNLPNIVEKSF